MSDLEDDVIVPRARKRAREDAGSDAPVTKKPKKKVSLRCWR